MHPQATTTHTRIIWLILASIALYMLAWIDVPLFYDEVAFRMASGRGFLEGFVKQNYFAQCRAELPTQPLFLPVHYFYSWWDEAWGWAGLRTVPLLALTALVSSMLYRQRLALLPVMVLSGAFIGVTGLGFILSRPEYLLLLHAAAIIATWRVAQRPQPSLALVLGVLTVHGAVVCFSLFAHMQGLLLMPLSFLACLQLLRGRKILGVVAALFLVVTAFHGLAQAKFFCPEDPVLEQALNHTQGNGYGRYESDNFLIKTAKRAWRFERTFLFRANPEIYSQPIPSTAAARLVNPLILALVTLNGIALVAATGAVALRLWRTHGSALRRRAWRLLLNDLLAQGMVLWFAAALLLLFYSWYDVAGSFYRAHARHLLTVVLLVLFCLHMPAPKRTRLWLAWGWLAVVTCIASTIAAWVWVAPPLANGHAGVGVPRTIDARARDETVRALAKRCGIAPDASRVVVDDATYTALRTHHRPISYLYIWFGEELKPSGMTAKSTKAFERYITNLDPSGYVVRCRLLEPYGLQPQLRDGEFCCKKYRG